MENYDSKRNIPEKIWRTSLLPEYLKTHENSDPKLAELEKNRFTRASVILIVISTPVKDTKIPTWEMQLSAGAVCQNLLMIWRTNDAMSSLRSS